MCVCVCVCVCVCLCVCVCVCVCVTHTRARTHTYLENIDGFSAILIAGDDFPVPNTTLQVATNRDTCSANINEFQKLNIDDF